MKQFFSGFIDFVKSRYFWIHLLLASAFSLLLLFGIYSWLNGYTKHGESITVPDLRGMSADKLDEFVSSKHLRYAIVDSVFELGKAAHIVIQQDPAPNSKVKEDRTIYLTINSSVPPKTSMPNLIDVSERQALAMLESAGLRLGKIIYKPDLIQAVMSSLINGREIKPGEQVNKGSFVDLVMGDGIGVSTLQVPNLMGLSMREALFSIKASGLNIGNIYPDESVRDSMEAKVYKQVPEFSDSAKINQGEPIDLYTTQIKEKIIIPEKHD